MKLTISFTTFSIPEAKIEIEINGQSQHGNLNEEQGLFYDELKKRFLCFLVEKNVPFEKMKVEVSR